MIQVLEGGTVKRYRSWKLEGQYEQEEELEELDFPVAGAGRVRRSASGCLGR